MTGFKYLKTAALIGTLVFGITATADQVEGLPADFTRDFTISGKGVVTSLGSSRSTDRKYTLDSSNGNARVFSKSSDTTAWHVGSAPCAQNKQFNCLSVYTRDSSRIRGNQMNPFADEDHRGNYSLYRVDKDTGVLNSVIKCKSMFTTKMTVDEASLKNCNEYSQKKCSDWFNYINNESGLANGDMEKARECTDLFTKIDRARLKAVQIFQGDLKNSQKDLESQFDDATRADKGFRIAASVKVNNSKPNSTLLQYEDLIERSSDCSANAAWFEKAQRNQDYLRGIFGTPATTGTGRSTQGRGTAAQPEQRGTGR